MSDEDDDEGAEKKDMVKTLAWWVRYALVPIIVALIAGISAVRAAELLSRPPDPAGALPAPTTAGSLSTATAPAEGLLAAQPPAVPADPVATQGITPTLEAALPADALPAPTLPPPGVAPTSEATPTPTPTPPSDLIGFHVVRPGEYLYCIGRAYGVRPDAIARSNGLARVALLHAGQVLAIPSTRWRTIPAGATCAAQFASPFPAGAEVAFLPVQANPAQLAYSTPRPPTATPGLAITTVPTTLGDTPTSSPPETTPEAPAEKPAETPSPAPPTDEILPTATQYLLETYAPLPAGQQTTPTPPGLAIPALP